MESRKGFTLVELMVVILIVGILAAVAIPIMRGRIDSAKWSEGRSMMGTIGTAIRACCAETDAAPVNQGALDTDAVATELGFRQDDLDGTYFSPGDFSYVCTYDPNMQEDALTFTITATRADLEPDTWTLDQAGTWGH